MRTWIATGIERKIIFPKVIIPTGSGHFIPFKKEFILFFTGVLIMKDIVVAGAGHGGLVAAALLAKQGFVVRVFESKKRAEMGWDWHDGFKRDVFEKIGMHELRANEFHVNPDTTFFSPDLGSSIVSHVPLEKRSISMDRKLLLDKLLSRAIDAGVTIEFGTKVNGPLLEGGEVAGIVTDAGPIEASLVIDATGMDSTVRKALPASYGIQGELRRGEIFHSYRAYFDLMAPGKQEKPIFHVQFGTRGIRGITWVRVPESGTHADVIVGKIDPFEEGELDAILDDLRSHYPSIGTEVLQGGQFARIPVRRPLDRFVGKNYAAIGDSACMAVPLTGSGIETSMLAGKVLADTINSIGPKPSYSLEELWRFQQAYIKDIGATNYAIGIIKNFMLVLPFPEMSFIFKKRLITGSDISSSVLGEDLKITVVDMLKRFFRGFPRMGLLLKVKDVATSAKKVKQLAMQVPPTFDKEKVVAWTGELGNYYESYEKELRTKKIPAIS